MIRVPHFISVLLVNSPGQCFQPFIQFLLVLYTQLCAPSKWTMDSSRCKLGTSRECRYIAFIGAQASCWT